jgi:hypothetical protein
VEGIDPSGVTEAGHAKLQELFVKDRGGLAANGIVWGASARTTSLKGFHESHECAALHCSACSQAHRRNGGCHSIDVASVATFQASPDAER